MDCKTMVKSSWYMSAAADPILDYKNQHQRYGVVFLNESTQQWFSGRAVFNSLENELVKGCSTHSCLTGLPDTLCDKSVIIIIACCTVNPLVFETLKSLNMWFQGLGATTALLLNTPYKIEESISSST